jgi:hypothetical protein
MTGCDVFKGSGNANTGTSAIKLRGTIGINVSNNEFYNFNAVNDAAVWMVNDGACPFPCGSINEQAWIQNNTIGPNNWAFLMSVINGGDSSFEHNSISNFFDVGPGQSVLRLQTGAYLARGEFTANGNLGGGSITPTTITAASESGHVVSITAAGHGMPIGQPVPCVVAGISPAGYNGSFNCVASTTSALTYSNPIGSLGSATVTGATIVEAASLISSDGSSFMGDAEVFNNFAECTSNTCVSVAADFGATISASGFFYNGASNFFTGGNPDLSGINLTINLLESGGLPINLKGSWTPTATSLTTSGGSPTLEGLYTQLGNMVTFTVTITPAVSGTTSSTANTTYITLPTGLSAGQPAACYVTDDNTQNIGIGQILVSRIYLPSWSTDATTVVITGSYQLS